MKTGKKLLMAVFIMVMVCSFASVGLAQSTLHFYAWTNADNMKALLAAFNQDFAGKYELVYEKMADATTLTINTALSSGAPIDVMTRPAPWTCACAPTTRCTWV